MNALIFFDTREELRELTGLPDYDHDRPLWEAGFDLDDWDFGFVSDKELADNWGCGEGKYWEYWLLTHMEDRCVGYKHVEYNGRHYYMAYHS